MNRIKSKRKQRRPKTASNLKQHFDKRWYQRVNANVDSKYKLLNELIQGPLTDHKDFITFVEAESLTRTKYRVIIKKEPYIVVYNKKLKSVVTIYPEGSYSTYFDNKGKEYD